MTSFYNVVLLYGACGEQSCSSGESLVCVKTLAFASGDFPKTGHKRYQICLAWLWSIGFGSPIGFRLGFGSPFEQANGSVHARHESSVGMQPYA